MNRHLPGSFLIAFLLLLSCNSTSKTQNIDMMKLDQHRWVLSEWQNEGGSKALNMMEECFVMFDPNLNKVQGSDGCNAFNGSYERSENDIKLGPVAGTKKYCGEESSRDEAAFITALSDCKILSLNDEELKIGHQNEILIFKSK